MKIGPVFNGILVIIAGLYIYNTGWINRYQLPVPPAAGLLFSLFGIAIVIYGLFPSNKKKERFYICDNCKEKYNAKHVEIMICPKCNGKLVKAPNDEKV